MTDADALTPSSSDPSSSDPSSSDPGPVGSGTAEPSTTESSAAEPATADAGLPVLDESRTQFVEQFALVWATAGNPRMEGRIMGLLMILDQPYLSSTQIATMLHASAGAVSTSTRQLVDVGFLKRHVIPGDRNHYFRVEDDIWGGFLAGERHYLERLQDVIETGFAAVPGQSGAGGDAAEHGPLLRLTNARLYITWLAGYHRRMLADWQAYRDAAHAAPPTPEDTP